MALALVSTAASVHHFFLDATIASGFLPSTVLATMLRRRVVVVNVAFWGTAYAAWIRIFRFRWSLVTVAGGGGGAFVVVAASSLVSSSRTTGHSYSISLIFTRC